MKLVYGCLLAGLLGADVFGASYAGEDRDADYGVAAPARERFTQEELEAQLEIAVGEIKEGEAAHRHRVQAVHRIRLAELETKLSTLRTLKENFERALKGDDEECPVETAIDELLKDDTLDPVEKAAQLESLEAQQRISDVSRERKQAENAKALEILDNLMDQIVRALESTAALVEA